jgi:hypothetical protein
MRRLVFQMAHCGPPSAPHLSRAILQLLQPMTVLDSRCRGGSIRSTLMGSDKSNRVSPQTRAYKE